MSHVLEPRSVLEAQLNEISAGILQMMELVIEGIGRCTQVLLQGDLTGAREVIAGDDEIDLLQVEIEESIGRGFALQQPVASDLRLLISALKMAGDLERSGDLISNIAKGTIRLGHVELDPGLRGLIAAMREESASLFEKCSEAFRNRDAVLAGSLRDLDDELDDLHRRFIVAVFASHADGQLEIQQAVQLCVQGRFYERLGDHAVNIAERTQYLVTGLLPAHSGAARARERTKSSEMK